MIGGNAVTGRPSILAGSRAGEGDIEAMDKTSPSAGERRRSYNGPAIFSHGFRPFFLFGSLYAGGAVVFWIAMLAHGTNLPGSFQGFAWHAHEMIFGYVAAIVAGFVLTAVPNWTGRMPVSGAPLGLLLAAWLSGRVALAAFPWPWIAFVTDMAFLLLLSAGLWREILAGRNWRNVPVCVLVSLLAAANVLSHAGQQYAVVAGYGDRLALGAVAMLIGLIGGRVVPSFTRNWMARLGIDPKPAPFGRFDQGVLLVAAAALTCWVIAPEASATGIMLAVAGGLHLARLLRWHGAPSMREPIVAVLHLGYMWLALAFIGLGGSVLFPVMLDASSSLHMLTAGAIGTMTLAIMTRASLGHTGHAITAGPATLAIYALVTVGAIARSSAAYLSADYVLTISAGGILWAAAFLLFAIAYGPLLWRRSTP